MKNKKTMKNIIIGLFVAIALVVVYSIVNPTDNSADTNSLSSLIGSGSFGQIQESNTDLANVEILRILGSIQNISLEDDIFQNPVFRELVESGFVIPRPVRIGRPNPFLPIGFDSVTIQTNSSTEIIIPDSTQTIPSGFFDN